MDETYFRLGDRFRSVKVELRDKVPYRFRWRGTLYNIIRIIDYWRDVSEWWRGDPELWFWRVLTNTQGVYELVCDPQSNQWWIYRVYD